MAVAVCAPMVVSCDMLGEILGEGENNEQNDGSEDMPNDGNQGSENPDINKEEAYFHGEEILPLPSDAQEVTFRFKTNREWKITLDPDIDWVAMDMTEGDPGWHEVTVHVLENMDYDERNARFTVTYGDRQQDFVIYQNQKNAIILSASRVDLPVEGGSFDITVKSNMDVSIEYGGDGWLRQVESKGLATNVFSFVADPSEDAKERHASIYVSCGYMEEKVDVYQAGEEVFVLSEKSLVLPSVASEFKIDVRSNVEYSFRIGDNWISEVRTRSISSVTKTFAVEENTGYDARETEIIFSTSEGRSETVHITQAQKDAIVLARSEYEVAADGGILEFNVASNVDFDVECSEEWISRIQTKGLTDRAVSFNIQSNNNENASAREAVITFSKDDVSQQVTVRQKASSVRTIRVETAGTLKNLITSAELMELTALTLTGDLNQEDIKQLTPSTYSSRSYKLQRLDLSGATLNDNTIDGIKLSNLVEVSLPASLEKIGPKAFNNCPTLKSVTIPSCVKSFSTGAFKGCNGLTDVIFEQPSSLETFEYSSCGLFADSDSLKTFTIPESVTRLSAKTFMNSKIESIIIPETVRIIDGTSMFYGCADLKTVTLPSYFVDVEDEMFSGCSSLEELWITEIRSVGIDAFKGCAKLKDFDYASMVEIGSGAFAGTGIESFKASANLTEIPKMLFMDCKNLKTVDLAGVTSLGYRSFYGCSAITEIVIPETLTEIEASAFCACSSLEKVTFTADEVVFLHTANHGPFQETAVKELTIPANVRIISSATSLPTVERVIFEAGSNCEEYGLRTPLISEITLPSKLKKLRGYTFENCANLKSITLPEGLESIGSACFSNSAIETIGFPASLHTLGSESLSGMKFKEFTVPESIRHIKSGCFYNCKNLEVLNLPSELESFGTLDENESYYRYGVLAGTLITELKITGKNVRLGKAICSEYMRRLIIGKDVISIEADSPLYGSKIYEVEFEDGCIIESISGLYRNSPVTAVTNLPSSLRHIGAYTFGSSANLQKVIIPEGVTSLGAYCFEYDSKLTEVVLPESLKSIGEHCFERCTSLKSISIPDGVETMANGIFYDCSSLSEVNLPANIKEAYGCFKGTAITSLDIPTHWTRIPNGLMSGMAVTSVVVPANITEIGNDAFRNCNSLTGITLPQSLEKIGDHAFDNCSKLTSIDLPDGLETIGDGVFMYSGIKELRLNGSNLKFGNLVSENLEKIIFSNKLKSIEGNLADANIKYVEFEDGCQLTTFGYVFNGCQITELRIPASITSIEYKALVSARNINKLYFEGTVPPAIDYFIGVGDIDEVGNLNWSGNIYVPRGYEAAYKSAPHWDRYASHILPYDL